jgi:hypothetical protein
MLDFSRGCGPDAGRGRDTVRVDFELALLRSVSVNLAELRRVVEKVLKERNFLGFGWFNHV